MTRPLWEWRGSWWRYTRSATYARWRTARVPHVCDERDRAIQPGERYVETSAAPWHDIAGPVWIDGVPRRIWQHQILCANHPQWHPPESVPA